MTKVKSLLLEFLVDFSSLNIHGEVELNAAET